MTYSEETIMSKSKQTKQRLSLIDSIVTDISETSYRADYKVMAQYIQTIDNDVPCQRIGGAFVAAFNARENNEVFDFKPESVIYFIQEVANGLPRKANALVRSANKQEVFDEIAGGTGQDNYAELCESFGIDTIARDKIQDMVQFNLDQLNTLHAKLRSVCSYMDIDRLYLLSRDEFVEESQSWETTIQIDDLDEAMEKLNELAEKASQRKHKDLLSDISKLVA